VAVCGGSGFIGRHLITALASGRMASLRVLVHRNDPREGLKAEVRAVAGDLTRPDSLGALITPGCTVVNLAYMPAGSRNENLAAVTNLARACRTGQARRVVHVSTATVVGVAPDDVITESTPPEPRSEYERTKLEVERRLAAEARDAFELLILRPTAVFGPRGKNLVTLAARLLTGTPAGNYARACLHGRRRMNLVCVDNVVAAIRFATTVPVTAGTETFLVSDDDDELNNYRDVESALRARLGRGGYPVPPLPVPSVVLRMALRLRGRSNANPDRVYSASKLTGSGYVRPMSLAAGLASFADWYRESRTPAASAAA
jgi:nucleoside-diphosphate-sugar epimerase